jgi:glycosyltransferase involved in cell wall biosynthesis
MRNGSSIIIPVYNEEKILIKNTEKLVKFLNNLHVPYEILLCDNGSTDNTSNLGKLLESRFPKKVKFLSIPESRSVGYVFKEMVKVASFNNLIAIDMDLTIDFEHFIPECLKLLKENAMVIGSKKAGRQHRPFYRRVMSDTFISLVKLLLGLDFSDYSIGAKGYRKEYILDMLNEIDRSTFYVIKLAYFIKQKGLKITEIPVKLHDVRKSRFNIFQDAIYRGKNLLNFWFRERIIKTIAKTPT